MNRKLFAPVLLACLTACGKGNDQKVQTATTSASGNSAESILLTDEQATSQSVAAEIDTGLSLALEENESSTSSSLALSDLSLANSERTSEMSRYRACEKDAAKAVVTMRRSVLRDRSFENRVRSFSNKFEAYSERERTWSRADGGVDCAADGKRADLSFQTLKGVTLDATFKDQRSRSTTLENKRTGKSTTVAFKFENTGTRHVEWQDVTEGDGIYTVTKEASHSGARTIELTKKDGTKKTFTATVKSVADAPFVILVERDKTTLAAKTRTIKSGTLATTHKDGTRVETIFTNVKYDLASDDKCLAVSGVISGSVFKKDATVASATFKITFGESTKLVFGDGTELEYVPQGCELDDPEDQATEASTAEAVKAPADAAPTLDSES